MDEAITAWTSQRSKQEVTEIIAGASVPCGAVLTTLELLHDEDLHNRGMMLEIDHPCARQGHRSRLAAAHVRQQGADPVSTAAWWRQRGDLWRLARLLG